MRLALALGKTAAEVEGFPASEMARWLVWDSLSPIGEVADDIRHGQLCALVATAAGGKQVKPLSFMLGPEALGRPKDPAPKTVLAALWAWTKALGARVAKKE